MCRNKVEILDKLIDDTEKDIIKWSIDIEDKIVRATHEQELTPNKKLTFRILYYNDHPKSTRLYIYFYKKDQYGSSNQSIIDLGGNKKRNEARVINQLLNKILLKEDGSTEKINLDLDDQFEIGDRVVIIENSDFEKDEIIGQKGTIVNVFIREKEGLIFLVEFDNKFNPVLISNDFVYGRKPGDGKCWLVVPEDMRKIKS